MDKKWIKTRHKFITAIAYAILTPYTKLTYRIKLEPFLHDRKQQHLILMNHQTAFDQFFIGMVFKKNIYYLASEDLFSNGFISSLLRYAVAPIPIKKQTLDIGAVRNCLRIAKEGGSIALSPEGNRTYCGKTGYIKPSIVKFIKKIGLPIALFRIEGGYGVSPRWSDDVRRGKMRAYVHSVISPEEYQNMSNDELYKVICEGLYVDESCKGEEFYSNKNAEYLERVLYVCPNCKLSEFESKNDTVTCKKCGLSAKYLPNKQFKDNTPFKNVLEWYNYQCDFVNSIDISQSCDNPVFTDSVDIYKVNLYKNKKLICKNAQIQLYYDKIVFNGITADFNDKIVFNGITADFNDNISVTVLGRNKLNIYVNGNVYQFKGEKSFNALKYVNFYNHYKNISEGKTDEQFLGL